MADGELTLTINGELADRLRARAEASGQSVEEYALNRLQDSDGPTTSDNPGFSEAEVAYADEIDRICDEAERTGGVPWEQFRARLLNLGDRSR